jgi:hypothetical protein
VKKKLQVEDEMMRRVAAIIRAIQSSPQGGVVDSMACDITVCIPVFNSIRTLGETLFSLEIGAQSVPMKLILAENGSSDGTQVWLKELGEFRKSEVTLKWWLQRFREIKVVEVRQNEEYPVEGKHRELWCIRECMQKMFPLVQTDYLLMVDADVECPRGGVRTMREALEQDEKIGLVGIQYDPMTDHVKHGMAMMRSDQAKEYVQRLEMKPPYQCMCSQYTKMVIADGKKAVNLSPLSARHLKLEV